MSTTRSDWYNRMVQLKLHELRKQHPQIYELHWQETKHGDDVEFLLTLKLRDSSWHFRRGATVTEALANCQDLFVADKLMP